MTQCFSLRSPWLRRLPISSNVVILAFMGRFLPSILISLCLSLGNISAQAKSLKILGHVVSEHSSDHHDSHEHDHHHSHESDEQQSSGDHHHHHAELASATVHLSVLSPSSFITTIELHFRKFQNFLSVTEQGPISFSSSIFRPPIS